MVRITRYVHSCLLVEAQGFTALFDPGVYSYESKLLDISALHQLDYLFISHEHADHFHKPFAEELIAKFPAVKIISTPPVIEELKGLNAQSTVEESESYSLMTAPHESLPVGQAPANVGFHFAEILTHPGDSHSFEHSKFILAMPMTAPWGSMSRAKDTILKLKPKVVIPIHDWHWKPEALSGMYMRIREALATEGIEFIIPVDGESVELSLD